MGNFRRKKQIVYLATAMSLPGGALAQRQPDSAPANAEIIVTGTRVTGLKAADSAAPVQVVGKDALKQTGYTDLANALATSVPSLNVKMGGSDTSAMTVQAALWGLNPNDTLVLVNGKRRHGTANLSLAYSGAATADLSFVPVDSIDHIEVLQDGAAAQYGSDAIAGVVNIILKTASHGGSLIVSGGQYFGGGGSTGSVSLNGGVALGERGYLNLTAEYRGHDYSTAGIGDTQFQNPDGSLLAGLDPVVAAGVAHADDFPRQNRVAGDPRYSLYSGAYNAGYEVGEGVSIYSFGTYGRRNGDHFENYRGPTQVSGVSSGGETILPFPEGFSPKERLEEIDYSGTLGIKGGLAGWNWDLSTTYGASRAKVFTIDSANASLFSDLQSLSAAPVTPQRDFYDGSFTNREWVSQLDLVREVNVGLASPLNVALGGEVRRGTYHIAAGEPASYYGTGAQSYGGFTPQDEGSHARTNYALYADLAVDPIEHLKLDVAGRYEHYSDFGSTWVGKATARYDFSRAFAIRGTFSNGFRGPTLAEEHYSGTNVSPVSAVVQLPANSPAAHVAGFDNLRPEKAQNVSFGFVAHPAPRLQITADLYQIALKHRIMESGFILGSLGPTVVSQAVLDAISATGATLSPGLYYSGVSIFTNGADTRTRGLELTVSYSTPLGDLGRIDWSIAGNYTSTSIRSLSLLPAQVQNPAFGQINLLTENAKSVLTTASPKAKVVLGANYSKGRLSVNLRETIYGSTSEWVSPTLSGSGAGAYRERIGATGIADLDIGYKLTNGVKMNVGANNLFNKIPPKTPLYNGAPVDGGTVYGVPYMFAPWGINGGYYYARLSLSF